MEKREGVKRVLITSIGGGNAEKDGVKYLKEYKKTVYEINEEAFDKDKNYRNIYKNTEIEEGK